MASLTFATRHLLLQMCAETNTNRPEHCTLLPPLNLIPIFLARSYLTVKLTAYPHLRLED